MAEGVELNEDFRDLLIALADAGADFLVVGAHALAVHGVVRATGDLDVLVRPTLANADRVLAALRAFGAPVGTHGVTREAPMASGDEVSFQVRGRRSLMVPRRSREVA